MGATGTPFSPGNIWSTVGTTNFDNRAFALNDEHNVCIHNARVAAEFERIFASDLAACDRVEMAAWHKRGIATKTLEGLASLLKEQV